MLVAVVLDVLVALAIVLIVLAAFVVTQILSSSSFFTMADASNDAEPSSAPLADSILSTLKPPPPYSVSVHDLTICAPVIPWTIPLGVPVPVPAFIRRAIKGKDNDEIPRELVRSVNLQVVPGEVLAM